MNSLTCFIYIAVFMQVTRAQILSYGLQNNVNQPSQNLVQLNPASNANIAKATSANIGSTGMNFNNLLENSIARNPNIQVANLQTTNLQATNTQALNNGFGNINNANFATQIGSTSGNLAAQNRYANIGIGKNFANFNGLTSGNSGGYNFGNVANNGLSVNGKPEPQAFGISVVADALEVGGRLAFNGRMPFYGAVAVNSQLPTEGSATVSYSCGGPTGY